MDDTTIDLDMVAEIIELLSRLDTSFNILKFHFKGKVGLNKK